MRELHTGKVDLAGNATLLISCTYITDVNIIGTVTAQIILIVT